jgi:hypothetical protein
LLLRGEMIFGVYCSEIKFESETAKMALKDVSAKWDYEAICTHIKILLTFIDSIDATINIAKTPKHIGTWLTASAESQCYKIFLRSILHIAKKN